MDAVCIHSRFVICEYIDVQNFEQQETKRMRIGWYQFHREKEKSFNYVISIIILIFLIKLRLNLNGYLHFFFLFCYLSTSYTIFLYAYTRTHFKLLNFFYSNIVYFEIHNNKKERKWVIKKIFSQMSFIDSNVLN